MKIRGDDLLREVIEAVGGRKSMLRIVARCSIWAKPEIVDLVNAGNKKWCKDLDANVGGIWFPGTARGQSIAQGARKQYNEKASAAMWAAVGLKHEASSFNVCHVWQDTAQNQKCYTALANLVILPTAIHGLSEHWALAREFLHWKSYSLFHWLPEGKKKSDFQHQMDEINFCVFDTENKPKSDNLWNGDIPERVRKSVERRQLNCLKCQ
jgi:hypothetical protein